MADMKLLQQATSFFPPIEHAMIEPNGLLAMGGDLTAARLLDAYRHGIFPWFNPGEPILWWSPDPRMVLFPQDIRVSRSLAKRMRNGGFEIRIDSVFDRVLRACAAPRRDRQGKTSGTWISQEMMAAYSRLHQQGQAHSVEVWQRGELVGGLYGVAIGRMFYGESMFSRVPDVSKIALVSLCRQLQRWGFGMIDCQMETAHLANMGARPISRSAFCTKLAVLIDLDDIPTPWCFDAPD
jgi:leucyl/phenylalanyl-tRNA--protein transferase